MRKYLLVVLLTIGFWGLGNAQMTIEEQVADTACVCLSKLDTVDIKINANILKMNCLQESVKKNNEAIKKNFATEKRREEDQEKLGIRGSLLINVQNILTKKCSVYAKFEQKMQTQRESGRGRK
tara:strand:- start:2501 stop:2872 length:372 start_codon:yes stop_codon:yes gene_type:complete